MAQHLAYYDLDCWECGTVIPEGDPVYFHDGKLCEDCADEFGIVCPVCRGMKREDFETCFECKEE